MNSKRGMASHAVSLAVADGHTMADDPLAVVYVLGQVAALWAGLHEGAWLDGEQRATGLAAVLFLSACGGTQMPASTSTLTRRVGILALAHDLRRGGSRRAPIPTDTLAAETGRAKRKISPRIT